VTLSDSLSIHYYCSFIILISTIHSLSAPLYSSDWVESLSYQRSEAFLLVLEWYQYGVQALTLKTAPFDLSGIPIIFGNINPALFTLTGLGQ